MESPPPWWYPDPGRQFEYRYWDGARWTDYVSTQGAVWTSPLPPAPADIEAPPLADPRPRWPAWWAAIAVGAALGGAVVAFSCVVAGDAVGLDGPLAQLTLAEVGLYGTLLATCLVASRTSGQRFAHAFGLTINRWDWARGLGFSILGRMAAVLAALIFAVWSDDFVGSNTEALDDHSGELGLVIAIALSAVVVAPIIEEIFFRGLLQRALQSAMPVGLAIAVQAVLFGLAHTSIELGPGNVTIVAATAAAGAVFGLLVHMTRRLTPSIAAHAWFNLVPVAFVILAD